MTYQEALEFIGEVRAGISWERFSIYAVLYSDAFIDMLNDTEAARAFLLSKGIDRGYVSENIKNILYRLHFNRENDHYLALALPHTASDAQIRKRWKDLMLLYHPDRNIGDEHAALCASRINEAYNVLKYPEKRTGHERMKPKAPGSRPARPIKHRDKISKGLSLSPKTRRVLQRLVIPACATIAILVLIIIFVENKPGNFVPNPVVEESLKRSPSPASLPQGDEVRGKVKEVGIPASPQDISNSMSHGKERISPNPSLPKRGSKFIPLLEKGDKGGFLEEYRQHDQPSSPRPATRIVAHADRPSDLPYPTPLPQGDVVRVKEAGISALPLQEQPQPQNLRQTPQPDRQASRQPERPQGLVEKQKSEPAGMKMPQETVREMPRTTAPEENHKELEKEVLFFVARYISAYENGDIERFMDCFSKSAVENNSLHYLGIREAYQKNFESNRYRYALRNVDLRRSGDNVIVSGLYSIKKLAGDDRGVETKGSITWTIGRENGEFRIVRVEYDKR